MLIEQLRELLLERLDFGTVADLNVRVIGIAVGVMLVVSLGVIEAFERRDLGDDAGGEDARRIKLGDIGLADPLLLVVGVENSGPVRRALIGATAVELGGVVGNREKDARGADRGGDLRGRVGRLRTDSAWPVVSVVTWS